MANSINTGTQYRSKLQKGSIKANKLVKCTKVISFSGRGVFQDDCGNAEEYEISELIPFGYLKYNNGTFDITKDFFGGKDPLGNKDVLLGCEHITENVRGCETTFRFWEDCKYSSNLGNGYDYDIRNLSNQEVVDILLNEILYGIRPNLNSTSCVGTTAKGIDKDPNYHDGSYLLPNDKNYTITWCGDDVIIREGIDGGWYHSKDCGVEIYKGKMDWNRFKTAIIRKASISKLSNLKEILTKFPEVIDLISDKIKDDDKFKLSNEF